MLRRLLPVIGIMGAFMLHSGCSDIHNGFVAVASPPPPAEMRPVTPAGASVKTVRPPSGSTAAVQTAAAPRSDGTVSGREIFDFHPAGSPPGSWRQPFIIDPNDGPLAGDVRKTAAELKEFKAGLGAGPKTAIDAHCTPPAGAARPVGCPAAPQKPTSTARDPLALQ